MSSTKAFSRRAFLELGLGAAAGVFYRNVFAAQSPEPFSIHTGNWGSDGTVENEIWRMGAWDLANAIRGKKFSCREVIQAHLHRIEAVNGKLNAVTVVLYEEALRAAEQADQALVSEASIGPLHGVPMTIKGNIDLAGSATTLGVEEYKDNVPSEDAPIVAQLKQAGAIPIGRTNLPDMALRWHTDSELHGATLNPWNASLTPGGSSGGEAAALATGMTPLGLGNDYGGSLRYPAQCCGITSIRPSRGRIANLWASAPITVQFFAVVGPMARHVRDLRFALQACSGPDLRDPWWVPIPLEGPASEKPIRVAVTVDPGNQGVHPDVAAGVLEAARVLSESGYVIEEVDPPSIEEAAELWFLLVTAEIRTVFTTTWEVAAQDALAFLEQVMAPIPEINLSAYMRGLARRGSIARDWAQFAERYPLILGPISTAQPFPVGRDLAGVEANQEIRDSLRLVVIVNLLGLPSVAVPVGTANGIPQGVQIIGPMYREDLCLDAGETIEKALGVLTPIDPEI